MSANNPLVSVIVPVYRNQRFLKAGIESVLALDYEPLEILIRDDASPDDAYDAVKQIVKKYKGPHTVKLSRNKKNMSMGNYNRLMDDATADYIVVCHDDDIQEPDRVSRIMDVFLNRRVSMVTCNEILLDADSKKIRLANKEDSNCEVPATEIARYGWSTKTNGSALSWTREVYEKFGPIDIDFTTRISDWIFPFRASLLDGVYFLEDPLLYKHMHPDQRGAVGLSPADQNVNSAQYSSEDIGQIAYMLQALDHAEERKMLPKSKCTKLRGLLIEQMQEKAINLAKSRNRLHMRNQRMAWVSRDKGAMIDEEKLRDLEYLMTKKKNYSQRFRRAWEKLVWRMRKSR